MRSDSFVLLFVGDDQEQLTTDNWPLTQYTTLMFGPHRPSLPVRRWLLIGYWTVMYFLTHWPEVDRFRLRPEWPFPGFDKVVHGLLYAGWVVAWWWMLSTGGRRVSRSAMGWLAVGAAAYGIFDEITQAIVGRQPDLPDFAFDMLGALGTLAVLAVWQRRKDRREGPGRPLVPRQAARASSGV